MSGVAANTDRELFREPRGDLPSDYYAPSVFVTKDGQIGMSVGGTVWTATIAQWHEAMNDNRLSKYRVALGIIADTAAEALRQ